MLGPLLFNGDFFILKAHGDVDRPDTIVLTADDYRKVIHSNEPFKSLFSALLMTRALLFVGYSLNDPDFRLLFEGALTQFKDHTPERYAIMADVGPIERRVLRQNTGIRVLSYRNESGTHGEVTEFLEQVKKLSNEARESEPLVIPPQVATGPAFALDFHEMTGVGGAAGLRLAISLDQQRLVSTLTDADGVARSYLAGRPDWGKLRRQMRDMSWASPESIDGVAALLGSWLAPDSLNQLAEFDPGLPLTLDLEPDVEAIPWEWLPVGLDLLCSKYMVARSPIGVSEEARGYPQIQEPLHLLMISDPQSTLAPALPGAQAEAEQIVDMYQRTPKTEVTWFTGSEATFSRIAQTLRRTAFDVIHFAGHAWADHEDAYLLLAGSEQLRANETRSLLSSRPPAVMFINSHLSAFVPLGFDLTRTAADSAPDQDEHYTSTGSGRVGFTEMATNVGVGAFVGGLGQISDRAATEMGVQVHSRLLAGNAISEALRGARNAVAQTDEDDGTWAHYILSGRSDVRLTSPATGTNGGGAENARHLRAGDSRAGPGVGHAPLNRDAWTHFELDLERLAGSDLKRAVAVHGRAIRERIRPLSLPSNILTLT